MKRFIGLFGIIILSFLISGCFDLGSIKPIDDNVNYNELSEQAGVVELDGDANGGIDITKGGTNAVNAGAARTNLGLSIGSDILAQQTIGIADNNLLEVDGSPNSAEYARYTANGLEGRTESEFKADFNLEIGTDVLAPNGVGTNLTALNGVNIQADTILEASLDSTNAPTDNYLLSYDLATTGFTWVVAGAGAGTVSTIKENDAQVGGADIVTLDFLGADFDLTESPDTEIQIVIAAGITRDSELAAWVGTTNITTLGTIGTGVWNGTAITDGNISDTLTSSIFIGSGSSTNAVDLATAEISGNLAVGNLNSGTNASASTYWRGDGTWVTPAGSGDVTKVGTPVDNQIGIWTGDGTIEGHADLTFDGTDFKVGDIASGDYANFSQTKMTMAGTYYLEGTWTFTDSDVTPTAFQFVYDNTITGFDNGGLSFHDGHNVRHMLDVITLPTADGEIPVYDQDLDKWVAIVMSGDITMTEAGVTAIGNEKIDSDHYVDGSIDLEHLSAGAKFYSIAVASLGDATTPSVLTTAETTNKCISNYKASGADHVFTMPAAHAAGNVIFPIGDEFQVDIEPDSGANFYLNGTAMANDEHIQNTADTLGERIVGYCVNINGTLTWMFYSSDAAFVEETP